MFKIKTFWKGREIEHEWNQFALDDIVKIVKIDKGIRERMTINEINYRNIDYFKNKIGIIKYADRAVKLFAVDFYFKSCGIIEEIFHVDELARPSESELKKFKLFMERVNAKEIAQKL